MSAIDARPICCAALELYLEADRFRDVGFSGFDVERFCKKIIIVDSGCWAWVGTKSNGYGRFSLRHRDYRAPRISYELAIGPLGDLHIDHLCRNRVCVNPNHLEAVTNHENTLRGIGLSAQNAKKACCPRCGGSFSRTTVGGRRCLKCGVDQARKMRHLKRELAKLEEGK